MLSKQIPNPNPVEPILWNGLHELRHDTFQTMKTRITNYDKPKIRDNVPNVSEQLTRFSNVLLTMRSAREGTITNELDTSGEIQTQYLLTGRVKLNRFEDWDMTRMKTHKEELQNISERQITGINHKISILERQLNDAYETLFQSLVGKFISF